MSVFSVSVSEGRYFVLIGLTDLSLEPFQRREHVGKETISLTLTLTLTRSFFMPLFEQIAQWIGSPAKGRNVLIGVVLLCSLGGFGGLIYWNSQPEYQVLFSNLSQEDAGEMVAKLKEKKVPFQLSAGRVFHPGQQGAGL